MVGLTNHPSGSLNVSESDKEYTTVIKIAGRFLSINVLDHIILTKEKYCSLSDEGFM